MAAPKGNQFWKLRSKHGRDKLFTSPQLLWEAACEYFEYCDDNPLIAIEYNGKDADRCEVPKPVPYTLEAFCLYIEADDEYLTKFEKRIKDAENNEVNNEFLRVITRIRQIIRHQKFSGAAAGFFKENIIIRDLGLREAKDVNQNINVKELPEWLK